MSPLPKPANHEFMYRDEVTLIICNAEQYRGGVLCVGVRDTEGYVTVDFFIDQLSPLGCPGSGSNRWTVLVLRVSDVAMAIRDATFIASKK